MKRLSIILILLIELMSAHTVLFASDNSVSDYDALTAALSKSLISLSDNISGTSIYLDLTGQISLSPDARQTVEVAITSRDAVLVMEPSRADMLLTVTVTDASVIFVPVDNGYSRSVSLSLHVQCSGNTGDVQYSEGTTYTDTVFIPDNSFHSTDNAERFSKSVSRTVINRNHATAMAISLLLITSVLAYFAFNY